MPETNPIVLTDQQKSWLKTVCHGADEYQPKTIYKKQKLYLVIARWKGDWYRNVFLWEIEDRSTGVEVVLAVKAHLQSVGKQITVDL